MPQTMHEFRASVVLRRSGPPVLISFAGIEIDTSGRIVNFEEHGEGVSNEAKQLTLQ